MAWSMQYNITFSNITQEMFGCPRSSYMMEYNHCTQCMEWLRTTFLLLGFLQAIISYVWLGEYKTFVYNNQNYCVY